MKKNEKQKMLKNMLERGSVCWENPGHISYRIDPDWKVYLVKSKEEP